jgi:hypothetical protein
LLTVSRPYPVSLQGCRFIDIKSCFDATDLAHAEMKVWQP